jgi:PAS domain S-box-containing protein
MSSARNYLLALALVGAAVICRAALKRVSPDIGPYILSFPAIVAAGLFCGTLPASIAAVAAGLATVLLAPGPSIFAPPPFNPAQLNTLLFVPACAVVIAATHRVRHAAQSAALAEARLAEVFRQVPAAAAIIEPPDGRLLLNSRQSREILGHAPLGDIANYGGVHADGRSFAPDDYPIFHALRTGAVVGGVQMRYRRPDGRVIDLDVHAGPVHGPDGKIVAAVGMAFDVTQRMAAERRLLDSETRYRTASERLRAAIDAGGLGVWELDLVTRSMHMDAAMAAMLGMDPAAVLLPEAEFRRFIHPDDYGPVRARMQAAMAAGGAYAEECRMVTAQGQLRWIVSRGAVMPDMRKAIGVIRDVTQRREREDALRAALEARDLLMREADHRIKNSLQLVASLLSLQLSKAEDAPSRQALGSAIARVRSIANAHLALERSPDFRMIEVDTMVSELCARVGELNPAVEIQCTGKSGASLDAERAIPLGLITSELLTNALRHGFAPGEPGQVSLTIRRDESSISLVVADNGKGFPADARRIGLGSSVIAALSKQIGAAISTDSAPGTGTAVTVRLDAPAAETTGES